MGFGAFNATSNGRFNTAIGVQALAANTNGGDNNAIGYQALISNQSGSNNVGLGASTLVSNVSGTANMAIGFGTLFSNVTGNNSTAVGYQALKASTVGPNTAIGFNTLLVLTTGTNNVSIGDSSGGTLTTGSNNIYIGPSVGAAAAAEANTIRIGAAAATSCFITGISGVTSALGVAVLINPSGQLGTVVSSIRYKQNISDIKIENNPVLDLRPVSFTYKNDDSQTVQYGLIAEEVLEKHPDLVSFNDQQEPESVKYHFLTPMLINLAQNQQKQIENLTKDIEHLKALMIARGL